MNVTTDGAVGDNRQNTAQNDQPEGAKNTGKSEPTCYNVDASFDRTWLSAGPNCGQPFAGRPAIPLILRFQSFWLREVKVHSPET